MKTALVLFLSVLVGQSISGADMAQISLSSSSQCTIPLFSSRGVVCAERLQRADIYFIDKGISVNDTSNLDYIRKFARSKKTFEYDALKIADYLALKELKAVQDKRPEEASMVLDMFTKTGDRVTYYASQFNLCSADNSFKVRLDEKRLQSLKNLAK